MDSKKCKSCGEIKTLDLFYTVVGCKDGKRGSCIECVKKRMKTHWKNNEEKNKSRQKAYYQSQRDRIIEKSRKYYETNKDIIRPIINLKKRIEYSERGESYLKQKNYRDKTKEKASIRNKHYRDIKKYDKAGSEKRNGKVRREELRDSYVVHLIQKRTSLKSEQLYKLPQLIKVKKAELKLKRILKNKNNGQQEKPD